MTTSLWAGGTSCHLECRAVWGHRDLPTVSSGKQSNIINLVRMRSSCASLDLTWRAFSSSTAFLMGPGVNQVENASGNCAFLLKSLMAWCCSPTKMSTKWGNQWVWTVTRRAWRRCHGAPTDAATVSPGSLRYLLTYAALMRNRLFLMVNALQDRNYRALNVSVFNGRDAFHNQRLSILNTDVGVTVPMSLCSFHAGRCHSDPLFFVSEGVCDAADSAKLEWAKFRAKMSSKSSVQQPCDLDTCYEWETCTASKKCECRAARDCPRVEEHMFCIKLTRTQRTRSMDLCSMAALKCASYQFEILNEGVCLTRWSF